VIIQNAVRKCKEFTKEPILVLYHAVGYALIVDCSKKTIRHNETYADIGEMPIECEYEGTPIENTSMVS
jgi:hypothetical protein